MTETGQEPPQKLRKQALALIRAAAELNGAGLTEDAEELRAKATILREQALAAEGCPFVPEKGDA